MINKGGKIKSKNDSDKAIEDFLQNPRTLNAIVIDSFKGNLWANVWNLAALLTHCSKAANSYKATLPVTSGYFNVTGAKPNAVFVIWQTEPTAQNMWRIWTNFYRLALKAQSQCRATLETLSNITESPVIFAKRVNIAHNQQINNQQVNNSPQGAAQSEQTNEPVQQNTICY